jgi:hypothetical protein
MAPLAEGMISHQAQEPPCRTRKKAGHPDNDILLRQFCEKKESKNGGDAVGSVIKKRKKKMRKHKHKKLLARTRHQRRKK